jgi:hypothetical protein
VHPDLPADIGRSALFLHDSLSLYLFRRKMSLDIQFFKWYFSVNLQIISHQICLILSIYTTVTTNEWRSGQRRSGVYSKRVDLIVSSNPKSKFQNPTQIKKLKCQMPKLKCQKAFGFWTLLFIWHLNFEICKSLHGLARTSKKSHFGLYGLFDRFPSRT